ncbi:MAG: FAD:protein FMN transferase [Lachnospiraceae bacterium]|nr:FAD:protein FMN transferase [Lachnospiraceae bacterium]
MRKIIISFILLILAGILTGCIDKPVKSVSGTGFYFDTVVSFTVYGTDDESIIDTLFTICENGEYYFSATKSDGELYKLNKGEITKVDEWLYKCVNRAIYYSELLDGRYDISIRPVSKLWDFRSGNGDVPDPKDIETALEKVNYQDIELDNDHIVDLGVLDDGTAETIRLDYFNIYLKEGMELDLGSAAKGCIGDTICEYLKEEGIESAVISLGGNVQCLGGKLIGEEKKEDFKVAVKSPFDDGYNEVLNVRDKAVVTSGIYERCFEKDGELYHHILDATTGYPVKNDLAAVTIICDSGLNADILSTVCFLAGYDETLKKYGQLSKYGDFEAEFIYKDGSVRRTEGFEKYLKTE